jgi:glycosyltransferase involved in cell wall biosynthesis
MIRVCHVQVLPILSGVQRVMLQIFKQLDRSRYDLHVACHGPGPLTEELQRLGVRVHLVPALVRSIDPLRDFHAYRSLARLFRDERFQIVHTHSSKPGILGRMAARRAKVPWMIHHVHAFAFHEFSPRWKHLVYGELERRAAKGCSHIVFVNNEERELAVQRKWTAAEQCSTVYNGADLRRFWPADRKQIRAEMRATLRADDDEVLILFNGRFDYPKQPELLPAVAARLNRLRPSARWRLVLAGDGPAEPRVRQRVGDLGLRHRVTMLPWQDDSQPLLCAADIALHTSLAEGLPLALIEAQAAGLPTVASRAKGNREVVDDSTGMLCDVCTVEDYAQSLARLIDEPRLRESLGAAAREKASRCFDGEVNGRRIAALYDQLTGCAPLMRRVAA